MNKTITIIAIVTGSLVLGALTFGAGLWVGHIGFGVNTPFQNGGFYQNMGMMGYRGNNNMTWNHNGAWGGMMGYERYGNLPTSIPLTVDQVKQAVNDYLKNLNNNDLELKEVMIFDNNAYARVVEKSTGIGAMELLVDPSTLAVFPEYGPNMMWNLKYGHMGSTGMGMGMGMMGRFNGMGRGFIYNNNNTVSSEMSVSPDQALKTAQSYLDQQMPGYQVADDADPFYGYYTIDILKDGQPAGMLSVNGFSGQVFLHTWHGNFIEMSE